MFKCPKCNEEYAKKFYLLMHMISFNGCRYNYYDAVEICNNQENKS